MAFINDYTTEEERRLLASFKDDPITTLAKDFDKNPFNFAGDITYWTVDREKKTALSFYGVLDRDNPYNGEQFIFLFNGFNTCNTFRLSMKRHGYFGNKEETLKQKYGVQSINVWEILSFEQLYISDYSKDELFVDLATALSVYKYSGSPNRNSDSNKCKSFVKYNDKIYGK